jgi:hypothetical protein
VAISMVVAIILFGLGQVQSLRASGAGREAWATGGLWVLALAATLRLLSGVPVPSPLYLLEMLFRGLSVALRSF